MPSRREKHGFPECFSTISLDILSFCQSGGLWPNDMCTIHCSMFCFSTNPVPSLSLPATPSHPRYYPICPQDPWIHLDGSHIRPQCCLQAVVTAWWSPKFSYDLNPHYFLFWKSNVVDTHRVIEALWLPQRDGWLFEPNASVRATPKPASSMAHSTVTRALALWAHI